MRSCDSLKMVSGLGMRQNCERVNFTLAGRGGSRPLYIYGGHQYLPYMVFIHIYLIFTLYVNMICVYMLWASLAVKCTLLPYNVGIWPILPCVGMLCTHIHGTALHVRVCDEGVCDEGVYVMMVCMR